MARCKTCESVKVFWAKRTILPRGDDFEELFRWYLCEIDSLRDGDELTEGERGPFVAFRPYHIIHRCGLHTERPQVDPVGPHAQLHLLPNAPIEVVRAAFRALAKLHHPDAGGVQERMIAINQAYDEITGGE